MASYIQGVTDYIPQIQPFKPDFNFFEKALQTKESQYKTAYNKLSGLYGTLLNSPMLRTSDIERRDEFFKAIQSDIQKISEMDLSLPENVQAARQVFQPLLDDKYIVSDMAYTKKYRNAVGYGDYLKNCVGTEKNPCKGWWNQGDLYLDYWRKDYQSATDEEALGFDQPNYTPFVDVSGMFIDKVKGMGFKVTKSDTNGKYIVETTNGPALTPQLYQYMYGSVGQDPKVQQMYRVMASNARNIWLDENAPKYGNDRGAAEEAYFSTITKDLSKNNKDLMKSLSINIDILDGKIEDTKKKIDRVGSSGAGRGVSPEDPLMKDLQSYIEQKQTLQNGLKQATTANDNLTTDANFTSDKKARRLRMDLSHADYLLRLELGKLSSNYANGTMEQKITADPYGLKEAEHRYNMIEKHQQFLYDLEKITTKEEAKAAAKAGKGAQGAGVTGADDYRSFEGTTDASGKATAEVDVYGFESELVGKQTNTLNGLKKSFVENVFNNLKSEYNANLSVNPERAKVVSGYLYKMFGVTNPNQVPANFDKYPYNYAQRVQNVMSTSEFAKNFSNIVQNSKAEQLGLNLYSQALLADQKQMRSNIDNTLKYLTINETQRDKLGITKGELSFINTMFDKNGSLVSDYEFYNKWKTSPSLQGWDYNKFKQLKANLFEKFGAAVNEGKTWTTNGKPVWNSLMPSAYTVNNVGGVAAKGVVGNINTVSVTRATQDILDFKNFFNSNSATNFAFSTAVNPGVDDELIQYDPDDPEEYESYKSFINRALDIIDKEVSEGPKKSKESIGSRVFLNPVSLNDPKKVAFTFQLSPNFVTAITKGLAKGEKIPSISNNTISIVMDRDKAPAMFSRFDRKPIKSILEKGQTIDMSTYFPNSTSGISMGILNGRLSLTGGIKRYDPLTGNSYVDDIGKLYPEMSVDPDMLFNTLMFNDLPKFEQQWLQLHNSPNNPRFKNGAVSSGDQAEQLILQQYRDRLMRAYQAGGGNEESGSEDQENTDNE